MYIVLQQPSLTGCRLLSDRSPLNAERPGRQDGQEAQLFVDLLSSSSERRLHCKKLEMDQSMELRSGASYSYMKSLVPRQSHDH